MLGENVVNKRVAKQLVGFGILAAVIVPGAGCGKKEEPAPPANSNYYSGPLDTKPKSSGPPKGMVGEPGLK